MKRTLTLVAISAFAAVGLVASSPTFGLSGTSEPREVAYVTNFGGDTVSVLDVSDRKVIGQIKRANSRTGSHFHPTERLLRCPTRATVRSPSSTQLT
jgi:YVTN family beta-propeller protein